MESNSFLSKFFSLFVLSTLSFAFCDFQPCNFPAIFNFGDSNSDTGGFSAAFGQAGPPHGESFFRVPAGRYCDGRLLVDFIAEGFKLPYLSAFLDSIGSNFSHGANFATAGSTIKPVDCNLKCGFSPFSLQKQFYQFNDFQNRSLRLRKLGGFYQQSLPSAGYFSRALYTFDIGQNDLVSSLFANMTIDEVEADVSDLVDQFKNIVKYVYGRGGKHFWIHNTGPIGCLAYVLERIPVKTSDFNSHGCSKTLNQLAQTFNKVLKKAVIQLRDELPKAAITYVDLFAVKYSLFTDAQKHGFTRSLKSCCGHGGKYNYNRDIGCGMKKTIHGKEVYIGRPCEDPSKAVVWDGVHYTQAANKYLYDEIVTGAYSDPPFPLDMACHRQ